MDLLAAFSEAFGLITRLDPGFVAIVGLSLRVSLTAVLLAALIGLPLGAWLALARFPGRSLLVVAINALMGLPPVVAGLIVFLVLSRSGPLGSLGLLFTPSAMIIAQTLLVLPIVISLTRATVEELWSEYRDHLTALGLTGFRAVPTLLWDGRFALTTGLLAGFGRASAEVGAVLMVGGNIAHYTRTMTTTIALETSKGDLALALGLSLILMTLTLMINGAAYAASRIGARFAGS
ncbi:MAG: ABC transporter permease subunit [Beijerinckiaceae bacterium]|nr:ABC transporter permease subunit [Beijerinckiaceae bacterium]